ncbi:enhanced intracellular survival protein Eis [Mycobacterium sp. 236(2023)]|uniref:enhanced intracellular survival protein Eis n=1 Tax=Mycobacterium sp. 236(2023) TaxID=3038163 RepID=UPI0024153006|nr:enhanced intracellular survival protein Eis [Mycobacterium sp. 236(2023)]MDG4667291.1 enhanced intracellular survival protein Eis [Mycobacterium sp. 236(2023)]
MAAPLTFRSADDADWPAASLIAATGFGVQRPDETNAVWRSMIPEGGAVVACDGDDVVGVALFYGLQLTVPGGAVLPMAGVSWVAVAPTHRRRGALAGMFAELHSRMGAYPIAGLEASEGGIYGRFGYGPATVWESREITRAEARFTPGVPDPGGVRVVRPADHRGQLEDIYERWRLKTPGGLHTPPQLWDEVLADRESSRGGGTPYYCLLHPDGFAMYRVHGGDESKDVNVTKFAAVTTEAEIALWRVLLGLDLKKTISIDTHPDNLLPYLLTDSRLVRTTHVEDGLWLRMLDIPAVLQARTYAADLSVVVCVSDAVLGGGGRFALDISGGRARCEPTDAPADVHTSLSVLGSIYLGAHRASSYAAAHRLRCEDAALLAAVDAAFVSDTPAELGFGF